MASQEKFDLIVRARDEASSKIKGITKTIVGMVAAFQGMRMATDFLKDSTAAAIESEAAWNDVRASVERHGMAWDVVGEQIQNFASQLQRVTGLSDEAIGKSAQMFMDYGATAKQAMERVRVAADLAAGSSMNLMAATDLVAKASVGYTGTLSRYGIILDESLEKSEKFAAAIEQINEKFGGAALARMDATKTKLAELTETFGDMQEMIGKELLDAGLIPLIDAFNEFRTIIAQVKEDLPATTVVLDAFTASAREATKQMFAMEAIAPGVAKNIGAILEAWSAWIKRNDWLRDGVKLTAEEYRDLDSAIDGTATRMALMALDLNQINVGMERFRDVAVPSAYQAADAFGVTADEAERIRDAMRGMRPTEFLGIAAEGRQIMKDYERRVALYADVFTANITDGIMDILTGFQDLRTGLQEIFKGIAEDFVRMTIRAIMNSLATRLVGFVLGGPAGGLFGSSVVPPSGDVVPVGGGAMATSAGSVTINIGNIVGEEQYIRQVFVPILERDARLNMNRLALRA